MKHATVFLSISFMLFLTACAGTLPTNSYVPQNYTKVAGILEIGEFTYQPFLDGKVSKPNQMQNTAIGQILLSMDVAEYIKRGTALELEKSGITLLSTAPVRLDGKIIEFMADDLGYSIDLRYSIQYRLIAKESGGIVIDKIYIVPQKKVGKFGDAATFANVAAEMILAGYNLFIMDAEVAKILETTSPPLEDAILIK